jgi:hypothetical protein
MRGKRSHADRLPCGAGAVNARGHANTGQAKTRPAGAFKLEAVAANHVCAGAVIDATALHEMRGEFTFGPKEKVTKISFDATA